MTWSEYMNNRIFIIEDDILYEACMEVSWALKRVTENLEDYMDFIHDWANFY